MISDTVPDTSAQAAIRDLIGRHTQAQDAGRTDDVVALYTEDGVIELPGFDPVVGREALRTAFEGWAPTTPQLHIVTNTVITSVSAEEARAESDVAFTQRGESSWTILIVGHYTDTFRRVDGEWLISRRATAYQA